MRTTTYSGRRMVAAALVSFGVACGSSAGNDAQTTSTTPSDADAAQSPGPGEGLTSGDASNDGSAACDPPDLLVVLDRTDSMSKTPNGEKVDNTLAGRATTKWALAVDALNLMVAPPRDSTIRFGLELFPQNPETDGGSDECPTLPELLGGQQSTNPSCQPGQVVVAPALGSSSEITASVGQDTTPLCVSTPIGSAMQTASGALAAAEVAGRSQYLVLVTDGGETCAVDALPIVQALGARGVKTFVVGFGQDGDSGDRGVNVSLLNDLACAGLTASDAATNCSVDADGGLVANTGSTEPLFFSAQDSASLDNALGAISAQVCCGCPR